MQGFRVRQKGTRCDKRGKTKTFGSGTTILFGCVVILIGFSQALGQHNSHTEGLTEEEHRAPPGPKIRLNFCRGLSELLLL